MARPSRNSSPDRIGRSSRTFFATTKTSLGRRLFQADRNASLLVDVLRSLVSDGAFTLHDFVIMPDHLHLLLTVDQGTTIEKAMQLVKGRFSYRLKKVFGVAGEIWQRGFSEVRVLNAESFFAHRKYIAENPVKAGLVDSPEKFPYSYGYFARLKSTAKGGVSALSEEAGAKAHLSVEQHRHD